MKYHIEDLYRTIKFGFQRMFRGYDDSAHWSLDSYVASIIVPVLEHYKTDKHGLMSDHTYKGNDFNKGWHTEESQNAIFDEIIFAMKNSIDDLEHIEEVLGTDYNTEDLKKYNKRVTEGLKIFGEYFQGLWT